MENNNKIIVITFQSYLEEAHPYCLETLDYIASNYHCIEEFKVMEFKGKLILAKSQNDESQQNETAEK